jgi:hypothetical protein
VLSHVSLPGSLPRYASACFDTLLPNYSALLTMRSCSSMRRLPSIRRWAATHAAQPTQHAQLPSSEWERRLLRVSSY